MTGQQYATMLVCVGIFALGQFHRASGSIFTPILMDRYTLPAATIGGLVSMMFVASIVAQIPFGYVLDKTGPRRVLVVCILTIAAGTLVFALALSFEGALVARILIGLGSAAMGAASYVIIARNFPKADFGYVNGLVVTMGGVGGLLGTYPLALALDYVPWSIVFGTVAAITVLLAIAVYGGIPKREDPSQEAEKVTGDGYLSLLGDPEILKILTLSFMTFAPIVVFTGLWAGPFLQDVLKMTPQMAGAVLLVFNLATITGAYAFGRFDRAVQSRRALILIGAGLSVGCYATLALIPHQSSPMSVLLVLIMIFCQQFYIPLGAHMRRIVPDHLIARASTLLIIIAVAAIPILQVAFGVILDVMAGYGFSVTDQFRAAFAAMAALIAFCTLVYCSSKRANEGT